MERHLIYICALYLCLSACSHKKTDGAAPSIDTIPMMVMQIQKCSKLYTAEYHLHKIITHDDKVKLNGTLLRQDFNINLPLGKRKVAIPMDATIKAYIDFDNFSEANIRRRGNKIELLLPDPKVTLTSTRISHDEVKQYVALTRRNFSDEELTLFEQQGRAAIIKDIPQLGIIETARASAARTLIPIIQQMGYKEADVTVSFRKKFTASDIETLFEKTTIENARTEK